MGTLAELSHKTFYEMRKYSQFVIDEVRDLEDELEDMTKDEIGAKIYRLKNVLELINPERTDDIEAINDLVKFLENE